jgi:glycosyltransferase involved in cell wall biosynthesis
MGIDCLTVVIATYNRCDTLKKAILAYQRQTELRGIREILVVDDGSSDTTPAMLAELAEKSVVPIRHLRQENKGPATARNVGIRQATTDLILFTDDDIIPSTVLVAEHLNRHREFPQLTAAVLGYMTWSPEVNPTPFMEWYGKHGALLDYSTLDGQTEIAEGHFYTGNISLKTAFLRQNGGFDEDFKAAAYEDIEFGYRLRKAGMRLFYNRKALAYHEQFFSFAEACRRSHKAAVALKIFKQKEAGREHRVPPRLKQLFIDRTAKLVGPILSPFRRVMDTGVPLPPIFYKVMYRTFAVLDPEKLV